MQYSGDTKKTQNLNQKAKTRGGGGQSTWMGSQLSQPSKLWDFWGALPSTIKSKEKFHFWFIRLYLFLFYWLSYSIYIYIYIIYLFDQHVYLCKYQIFYFRFHPFVFSVVHMLSPKMCVYLWIISFVCFLSSPSFKYFCRLQPQTPGVRLVTGSGRGPPGKLQILRCWFTEKQQTQYVSFNFRSNCKASWLISTGFWDMFPNCCWLGSNICI